MSLNKVFYVTYYGVTLMKRPKMALGKMIEE